jgi:cytidylate kinase
MNNKQNFLFNQFVYGSDTSFYSETAINTQVSVIREVADKGESCILFGRCSDYVLREYPNVINLFFFAPLEKRIAHIAKTYELTEKEAEKMIKRIDKQRHNYYKYVTGRNRGDRQGKHLMIDVIDFGVEGSVELIEKAINIRFSEDK